MTSAAAPKPNAPIAAGARGAETDVASAPLRRAGIVSRAVALTLDVVFLTAGITVVTSFTFSMWNIFLGGVPNWAKAIATFAIACTPFTYFFSFAWFGGRTPGDMLMGLRVVRSDGTPMTLVSSLLFGGLGVLLALIWVPGMALIVLDDDRRSLHDRVFGTAVVYAERPVAAAAAVER